VKRDAIRRLNPATQSRTLATLRDPATAGLPKLLSGGLSGELSVVALESRMETLQ